jgi:hypothetical protein
VNPHLRSKLACFRPFQNAWSILNVPMQLKLTPPFYEWQRSDFSSAKARNPTDRRFFLKTGEVILTSRLANASVLGFRGAPGFVVGLPAVAGNQPYSITRTATKRSELHAISVGVFRDIVRSNPRLSFRVLGILAGEVRSARLLSARASKSFGKPENKPDVASTCLDVCACRDYAGGNV